MKPWLLELWWWYDCVRCACDLLYVHAIETLLLALTVYLPRYLGLSSLFVPGTPKSAPGRCGQVVYLIT
jgi:hypothetical protein